MQVYILQTSMTMIFSTYTALNCSFHPSPSFFLFLVSRSPSLPVWVYQVCLAFFLTSISTSPLDGDELTVLLPLHRCRVSKTYGYRSDDTTTDNHWPLVHGGRVPSKLMNRQLTPLEESFSHLPGQVWAIGCEWAMFRAFTVDEAARRCTRGLLMPVVVATRGPADGH